MSPKAKRILAVTGLTIGLLPVVFVLTFLLFRPPSYEGRRPPLMVEYEQTKALALRRMITFLIVWPVLSVGGGILIHRKMKASEAKAP